MNSEQIQNKGTPPPASGDAPEAGNIKTSLHWYRMHRLPSDEIRKQKLDDMFARLETEDIKALKKDNADSEIVPHNILTQLIFDCEQKVPQDNDDSNNDIQLAIDDLNKEIDKFSYAREVWRDLCLAIGKFFAYILAPLGLFSAVYYGCYRIYEASLAKTIRHPIFNAVKSLVELQLTSTDKHPLDVSTKLKYIALLSSINLDDTKKFLSTDPGTKLIPEPNTDVYGTDNKMTPYEKFVRNLFIVLHPTLEPENVQKSKEFENIKSVEEKLNSAYDIENTKSLCQMIHHNLTCGRKFGDLGERYKTLSIEDSPYKLYHQEVCLLRLACSTQSAFMQENDEIYHKKNLVQKNEEFLSNDDLNENGLDDFRYKNAEMKYKKRKTNKQGANKQETNEQETNKQETNEKETWKTGFHYVNNDSTLRVATKRGQKLPLLQAKMLGLIPPEKAEEFEKKGIQEIELMQVCFAPAYSNKDNLPSIQNTLDLKPRLIEDANKFAQAIIKKIDKQNSVSSNETQCTPQVPMFTGFCQGGMLAHSVATKNGYSSMSFNSHGPGKWLSEFAGENKHPQCHQSIFMEGDLYTNGNPFVYKSQFGQSFTIENISKEIKQSNPKARHASYVSAITDWYNASKEARKPKNETHNPKFLAKTKMEQKLNDMFARLETEDIKALKKDNADSEIIPHNILTQLIFDCNQQMEEGKDINNDIQQALDDLNREIDKFSYAREVWRDLCLAIGKFFAYCFPPPFFKAINNWLCKISEIGIRRTIRRPLFDKTLQLIKQFYKLNPQTPNQTRSMQLLYLLSSIDPSKTREQLQSNKDFASLFIPVSENKSAWDAYKDFRQKLDDDLYNAYTQIQSQNSNKIKLRVMNDNQNRTGDDLMMMLMLCSNLSRGQALPGAIDRGSEMVPASESPFIIYDQGRTLLELAVHTSWAFRFHTTEGVYTITLNQNEKFMRDLDGFDYKEEDNEGEHYVSKDGTLHAAIQRNNGTITLEDARKVGMVTPTVVQDLSLEENVTNIRPLYIIFRSARNFRDTLSSAKNIVDGLPKSIENADILAHAAIEQVRKENESNKDNSGYAPLVPVFLGFSMGGMEAQAISKKYGFASISFNSLGSGDAVRDYAKPVKEEEEVEEKTEEESTIPAPFDKFVTAYTKFIDAINHQGFIMPKDWVADVDDNLAAEIFTGKPQIGQTYRLDLPDYIKEKDFVSRHAGYVEATRETVERLETVSQPENQSQGS